MKVSILIPVYNVAPWIWACLDSVFAQTCLDFECICVDDGSTDGSSEILDEYQEKFETLKPQTSNLKPQTSNFHVVHQPNGGEGAARNAALRAASGEWVVFLDADDVLDSRQVEVVCREAGLHPDLDLVGFGIEAFRDGDEWRPPPPDGTTRLVDLSHEIRAVNPYRFVCYAYRRTLLEGLAFPAFRNGEDVAFLAEALARAKCAAIVPEVLYGYRQRASSASRSACSLRRLRDLTSVYMGVLRTWDRSGKGVERSIARLYENAFLESFWTEWLPLSSADRAEAWSLWLGSLGEFSRFRIVGLFNRLRAVLLLHVPVRVLAFVLCYVPYRLKRWGLRRG